MKTETIDLRETLEELQTDMDDEIAEIEADQQDLIDSIEAEYGDLDGFEAEDPDGAHSVETTFDELEEERAEVRQQAQSLEDTVDRVADDYGGTEFVVSELTLGQSGRIQDMTGQQVSDGVEDVFEAAEGAAMVQLVSMCIEESPPGAPADPRNYPAMLGPLIQKPIAELSGMVTEDMGKSSLRERMDS